MLLTSDRLRQSIGRSISSSELNCSFLGTGWKLKTKHSGMITEFLHPHSTDFYPGLRSAFLHQLSWEQIEAYSPVLVRDGWLSTLDFFYRNPLPPGEHSLLLMPSRMAPLVPEGWMRNVGLYSIAPRPERTIQMKDARRLYLILSVMDERQCSDAFLSTQLLRVKSLAQAKKDPLEVGCVVLFSPAKSTLDGKFSGRSRYYFGLMKRIIAELGPEIEFLSCEELAERDLADSVFLDLDEHSFYYSDSFVNYQLMSRGSIPILSRPSAQAPIAVVDASFYHQYAISILDAESCGSARRVVSDTLRLFSESRSLQAEHRQYSPELAFIDGIKFCSRSFESMAYDLARRLESEPGLEPQHPMQ